jgi:hypothetical protein
MRTFELELLVREGGVGGARGGEPKAELSSVYVADMGELIEGGDTGSGDWPIVLGSVNASGRDASLW